MLLCHYKTKADENDTDNPSDDPNITGDPLKTLFVGRLSYNTEKRDLEREFGRYGPISDVCLFIFHLLRQSQD